MFRKLGIVTAGVVVIVALGSPAVLAAGKARAATVRHATTSGGVTFVLTGDAREVATTSAFSTVAATCTIVGGENADPNAQVVPDCYVRDITSNYSSYLTTTWMYSGHGSAAGLFEFNKGHELELCVGAHTTPMLGQGWGVRVEAPCERLR